MEHGHHGQITNHVLSHVEKVEYRLDKDLVIILVHPAEVLHVKVTILRQSRATET